MPNFFRPVTCFCVAALLCTAPAALAQATLEKTPDKTLEKTDTAKHKASTGKETQAAPKKETTKPAPAPTPPPTYRLQAQSIQVQELAPAAPGLVAAEANGLRPDLWGDIPYETWNVLLNSLPAEVTSPALRHALANTLLATAPIPHGDISTAAEQDTRSNALLPFISAGDYQKFVASIPANERTPLHASRQRELDFAESGAAACTTLPKEGSTVNDMLWQLYCTLANKNDPNRAAAAQLQLDLLRERGDQAGDEVALADALLAHADGTVTTADLPPLANATVLKLRLLSTADDSKPAFASTTPLVKRTALFIALERGGSEGAAAAEQLAANGLVNADTLRDAYSTVPFTDAERADAEAVSRMTGATQRAYMWQQLSDADTSEEKLSRLNDFISAGGVSAVVGTRGEILLPYLFEVQATAESAWAAPSLFALAAGQQNSALANIWYDTAADVASTMPEAQKWLTRLWPLGLAMQLDNVSLDRLQAWVAIAQSQSQFHVPVADSLTILEAAGFPIPAELWALVTDTPTLVQPGQLNAKGIESLRAAAAADNQGEVILRAANLVGGDIRETPPAIMAVIIRALADVGLADTAQRLTVEALLNILYPVNSRHGDR